MPHIQNLRTVSTDTITASKPQAMIDTPEMVHSEWLNASNGEKVGSLPGTKVAIVGAGIAGLIAAYELSRAGATVDIYEATNSVGGRLDSRTFLDSNDVFEYGAMRFPPSEELLYYYAEKMDFHFQKGFPDPGVNKTVLSYKRQADVWEGEEVPDRFRKVYNGWIAFCEEGLHKKKEYAHHRREHAAPDKIRRDLLGSANNKHSLKSVTAEWSKYLDEFSHDTFYSGLQHIFGPEAKWKIPGEEAWSKEDFKLFGSMGIGSGGFGALYPISFNYIIRLIINGFETDQSTIYKGERPAGVNEFAQAVKQALGDNVNIIYNAPIGRVWVNKGDARLKNKDTEQIYRGYDAIIVTTTPRSANLSGITDTRDADISQNVDMLHMIPSTKIFLRTKKFWAEDSYDGPRNILSDTGLAQLYTLDYGSADTGVVLINYTWGDLSMQLQSLSDVECFEVIKKDIDEILSNTEFRGFASKLKPYQNDWSNLGVVHWQNQPWHYGAFTLALPGQEQMIKDIYFNFLTEDRVFYAGDSVSFSGGWVQGALETSLNAVSRIIDLYGSLDKASASLAPVHQLDGNRFRYGE